MAVQKFGAYLGTHLDTEKMFAHNVSRRGGSDRLELMFDEGMKGWMDGWIMWMKEWYVCSVIK